MANTILTQTGSQVQADLNKVEEFLGPIASGKTLATTDINPMTTEGDIIVGGASGTPTRLAKGSNGRVLEMQGGLPSWQPLAVQNVNVFVNGTYGGDSAEISFVICSMSSLSFSTLEDIDDYQDNENLKKIAVSGFAKQSSTILIASYMYFANVDTTRFAYIWGRSISDGTSGYVRLPLTTAVTTRTIN